MLDTNSCQKPPRIPARMTFRGVRSSKFRHVFGAPAKKQRCYDNVKITRNAHDSDFCAVNPKFMAVVVEVGGGGSFVVLPVDKVGRTDHAVAKVCGHSRPVLDIKWNPFNDNIIASASEDCTVKLWYIPDGGLVNDLSDYLIDLLGHRRRVMYLLWHPTAENILLSAGYDHLIFVWNIAKGQAVNVINCHQDTIYSMSFNRNGSLLATSCKDKYIRIIDPRNGEILRQGDCHRGTKASKVVYLGDTGRLFTTGFSKFSDRQYAVWSQNDLSSPLVMEIIDSSSGVLFPYYDHDTKMVYVAGKGDGNVRYYEILEDDPACIFYLSQFISGSPQRGFGVMSKRGCDTAKCEIFRFYKMHATKDLVEPISMIVPRKSEMFQDDIFPETAAPTPSLTADEWISGQNAFPMLMSLKTGTRVRTFKPVVYKPDENALVISDRNNDRKFMFLSEETKPDYRPFDQRTEVRQSAQIDHRPLGAESYNIKTEKDPKSIFLDQKGKKTYENMGTKFQDVQRKWVTGHQDPGNGTANGHNNHDHYKPLVSTGSTPVKSLTGKFDQSNKILEGDENDLRQLVMDQRKEIENLKFQVDRKEKKIVELEETIKRMSNGDHQVLLGGNLMIEESVS